MRYIIIYFEILVIVLAFDSCGNKKEITNKEEITEIIVETIKLDSLDKIFPICINLVNRYVFEIGDNKDLKYLPPPPGNKKGEPFVFYRFKSNINNSLGFIQTDSLFLVEQIDKNKNISLDLKFVPRDIKIKNVLVNDYREQNIYKFLIPLFNKTCDFAIVEYEFQCVSCGYGVIIYLKKINGKWIKLKSFRTWRS